MPCFPQLCSLPLITLYVLFLFFNYLFLFSLVEFINKMPQFDRYELGISLHGVECFLKTFEEIGQDLKKTIYGA